MAQWLLPMTDRWPQLHGSELHLGREWPSDAFLAAARQFGFPETVDFSRDGLRGAGSYAVTRENESGTVVGVEFAP